MSLEPLSKLSGLVISPGHSGLADVDASVSDTAASFLDARVIDRAPPPQSHWHLCNGVSAISRPTAYGGT